MTAREEAGDIIHATLVELNRVGYPPRMTPQEFEDVKAAQRRRQLGVLDS